jgi:hypothetical protein
LIHKTGKTEPKKMESVMSDAPNWHIAGDWFDNCSCAVACPCTFAQAPDNDYYEFVLFWHINKGHYGGVVLDDLAFVRVGRFDGDLWAAKVKGEFGIFIDESASDAQAEALMTIFGGRTGGFPSEMSGLFTGGRKVVGTERAKITYEITPNQSRWGVDIAGKVKAWAEALTGPTSNPGEFPRLANAPGSETGPGPQLVTWGKSTVCEVEAFGFNFSWTVSSAKHIPFDWKGP